ncbi:hypothetical protein L7F22_000301 [Adiantum nelumboides]|nr:hypothetical protein [Adiantum nelumboides]
MELDISTNGIQVHDAVDGFHLVVVPEFRIQFAKLQAQQGTNWKDFKKALKEEYFLEDYERVTKQSFMKWIKHKNKGLSTRELLQKFEKKYEHLSSSEQQSIRLERVELFFQATDAQLEKCLMMRVNKLIVADSSSTIDEEIKDKPASSKRKLEELVLDDLVKGIQELNLNSKAVKLEGLSSKGSTSEPKQ